MQAISEKSIDNEIDQISSEKNIDKDQKFSFLRKKHWCRQFNFIQNAHDAFRSSHTF